jgi:AcrR family transcriptional regulator
MASNAGDPTAPSSRDRRTEILDAAGAVLLRHGFRKASVDEAARVAGVSRQGVYLHFSTKDALFGAAIEHLLEVSCATARDALSAPDLPLEQRILDAFEAISGGTLDARLDDVLPVAERLTGRSPAELEGEVIAEFAAALDASDPASAWRRNGDSAAEVARALYATSAGLKRLVSTMPAYLDALRCVIDLVCTPNNN